MAKLTIKKHAKKAIKKVVAKTKKTAVKFRAVAGTTVVDVPTVVAVPAPAAAIAAVVRPVKTAKGAKGDACFAHSMDAHLEFFSKAGSLMSGKKGRKSYHGGETTALELFKKLWDCRGLEVPSMKLLFWLRDPRGGSGNRSAFRNIVKWLASRPDGVEWLDANLPQIPLYGRWDDLTPLFGTALESQTAALWAEKIVAHDHLACKWADRSMKPLQAIMQINEARLRKLLALGRATCVEVAMCSGNWSGINYQHVPSKAMANYTKAFGKHDSARFNEFKAALTKGEAKVNASVLFPHDCMRTALAGDPAIADAQFTALPNFLLTPDGKQRKVMVIADTSGSMESSLGQGQITALQVAVSLALYCSDKIGPDNPFYRLYMEFASNPRYVDWKGKKFSTACKTWSGCCDSTNLEKALALLLKTAVDNQVPASDMVDTILLVSDMQFDSGVTCGHHQYGYQDGATARAKLSVVDAAMAQFVAAGYKPPQIVYWNLAGHEGNQATVFSKDTALVSGFSPSILTAVLSGHMDPLGVLNRAIAKYEVFIPASAVTA